ncbi:peptidylprolyl isomerase [Brevundimonas lenta]|uniref:peptidylprolyl isomerase n=1 Tax=Brevundimonas lenta TaxID=424796 RepID=A0A7W6NP92_9CAUL|nr:peptidylprolyl isomerase [Brevundimonas lenta]MBB4082264.1 peptidyl-prolyl cis-trans isomerase A (cyclophilin A) [Brevundimonas lenta]
MLRRTLLSCIVALMAFPAFAQDEVAPVRVRIETSAGTIVAETDPRAPVTSANFLRYVDERRFDGVNFYRGMELGPNLGLIQGGTASDPARILPPIVHEPTSQTGLSHTDGALAMARYDPGTATGDFFIIVGDVTSLNAGHGGPDDPGFAVFGHVVEGMDVVRRILVAPKSPTEGEGVMHGQMLSPRVRIISVRRVD